MYLTRLIDTELENWRLAAQRKPLILRGARQVGKSSTVRQLARQFTHFVEINFDEQPQFSQIFERHSDVGDICELLSAVTNTPIQPGRTLLFLDEIQVCIPAIGSLRYFYEKMPDLHVVAAGSLLEFVLSELPSFGVGRVRSLFVYPFCFEEFLMANSEDILLKTLKKANFENPLPDILHDKIKHHLKRFLILGGMPEVVRAYVTNKDLQEAQRVLDDLIVSLESDFSKYKNRVASSRIREVFNTVVRQLGAQFSYTYPNASLNNAQIKEVLELLRMAGLIYPVTHTAANGIPIGAEINLKRRKYLLFDTGIAQRILGLSVSEQMMADDFQTINKGGIAELHVGLELAKSHSPYQPVALYFWKRESRNSHAEVDYVVQQEADIVPIEVKAGTKGAMQSMFLFMEEKQVSKGIRFSMENFGKVNQTQIFPLYAVRNMILYQD